MKLFTFLLTAVMLLAAPTRAAHMQPASFESASGLVDRISRERFVVHLVEDNHDTKFAGQARAWWYVELSDVPEGREVSITVDGIGFEETFLPVYSYDQVHWMHVPVASIVCPNASTLIVRHTFERGHVWLARRHPYTSHEQHELIETCVQAAAKRPAIDFHVRELGLSPDGHPIDVLSVTAVGAATNKRQVWVQARAHPGEPQGSWVAEGMLRFLLSDDEAARAVRAGYIVHVVPMFNVDGVTRGNYRFNGRGENLERSWGDHAPAPEVALLLAEIESLSRTGPPFAVALNLHSSHEAQAQPPYATPSFGPQSLGYSAVEARLWGKQIFFASAVQDIYAPRGFRVSLGAPSDFSPRNKRFVETSAPEAWWWRHYGEDVMAMRIATTDGEVGLDKRWADVDDWRALGAALAGALIAHEP